MSKFEVTKSFEARKLMKRSGLPTSEWSTIPFGAIISDFEQDGNREKFTYLGESYFCEHPVPKTALEAGGSAAEVSNGGAQQSAGNHAAGEAKLQWERLSSNWQELRRAKVPGGWLVAVANAGLSFYPDPQHQWDGTSQNSNRSAS